MMLQSFFQKTHLSVFVAGLLCCFCLAGCTSSASATDETAASQAEPISYSSDLFAMDTVMTLTAYGDDAQAAVEAASAEINRLDQLFSTNRADSCVSQLNQQKTAQLPEDGITVLQEALQLYQDTDGAFNIALYPIIKAWGFTTEAYRIPEPTELELLLQHTDGTDIQLDADTGTATLTDAAAEIDLGGIVKGYTSDQVVAMLREQGIQSAVISLGGNVQTLGTKPDGSLWRIGIQDPENSETSICVVETADKAVITSGPYQRYFTGDDGTRYHHIMDPQTGAPAQSGLSSVTIVSDSGILADGLSTALFVMGPEKALQYWQDHQQDFDTILITTDQQLIITAGLADCFESDRDYYVFGE